MANSNRNEMDRAVRAFLKMPKGVELLNDATLPGWAGTLLTVGCGVAGIVMVATLVKAANGWKLLKWSLTGGAFQLGNASEVLRTQNDQVRGILVYGFIHSPPTNGGKVKGLTAGTFEDVPEKWMFSLGALLRKLFQEGDPKSEHPEIMAMLKDDGYEHGRRRPLPLKYGRGKQIYLMDLRYGPESSDMEAEIHRVACAATEGPTGVILPVPWSTVERFVGSFDPATASYVTD